MGKSPTFAPILASTWPSSSREVFDARNKFINVYQFQLYASPSSITTSQCHPLRRDCFPIATCTQLCRIRQVRRAPSPWGNPSIYIDNLSIPAAAREFVRYAKTRADLDSWLSPLTDYNLRCDCGRSYCHAFHLADLVYECFAENPQDHLCFHDLCPGQWEGDPEGPEEHPPLCVQECDNECNPQDCDLGDFDLAVFDETNRDAMAQQQDQLLPIQHGQNRGISSLPQSEQLRFSCFGNSLLDADSSQLRLNSGVGLVLHRLTSSSMRTTICLMCVPRCYRWEFAGGQNCPVARGATMFIFQHDS